jgi:hypothetical protein
MTIRLFVDDLEYLQQAYPTSGYNVILRALAARHVRKLRTKTVEALEGQLTAEELKAV